MQGLLHDLLGAAVSVERVVASFSEGGYHLEEARRLANHVLAISGYEGAEDIDRELILNVWRLFLEALARQAPYIVVCENLYWASESLAQELVRGLAGQSATTDVLPDTVHAAVLARLDLLSKIEREVLQIASVANRTFARELFQEIRPVCTREEIEGALDGLVARDMLARAERIRLHKAIAAFLLGRAGEHVDDCAQLLAYHYHKAVPPKMESETERAIKFQVRAGELACRAGAFREALSYFQNAIELAEEAEKITLYERLGDSLARPWNVKIREAYQCALALWRALPERQPLAGARLMRKLVALNGRAYFAETLSPGEAEALWREGLQLAEQAADEGEVLRMRAAALFVCGDLEELSAEQMRGSQRARVLQQQALAAASYFEAHQH